MSGIVGILNWDGALVDGDTLQRMIAALIHRGPDRQATWIDDSIGLGHTLLRTTRESDHEQLPDHVNQTLWITADARIDNRDDLAHLLASQGCHDLNGVPDSALILRAYAVWGERCLDYLIGDFAFAIWDAPRQRLFCARDHFGVRPFVYYQSKQQFAFASEAKAILAAIPAARQINEGRIADYLMGDLEGVDRTSTFYQNISRLPPASYLLVGPEKTTLQTYWSLEEPEEILYDSDQEYADAFLEIFSEAVICRLRSPDRVGSMLSGGMDSSSIVGVAWQWMNQQGQGPMPTFSAISDDPQDVETHFIRVMQALDGIDPIAIKPSELESIRPDLEQLLSHTDDLFDHKILVPQIAYALAKQRGVKAVLTGVDGDLVASVHMDFMAYLLRDGKWQTAWNEAVGFSEFYKRFNKTPWYFLFRFGRSAFIPGVVHRVRQWRWQQHGLQAAIHQSIINPDLAQRANLGERYMLRESWEPRALPRTLRQLQIRSTIRPQFATALERYDRVAALYSIEVRHPFMDKRLVEFCLALPREQKIKNGWTKIVLRRAMAGILPDEIIWRLGWEHVGPEFTEAWLGLQAGHKNKLQARSQNDVEDDSCRLALKSYVSYDKLGDNEKLWQALTVYKWLQSH